MREICLSGSGEGAVQPRPYLIRPPSRACLVKVSTLSWARYYLVLVSWGADCTRLEFIAAMLDHLVRDLVGHFLDKQAQVTPATKI